MPFSPTDQFRDVVRRMLNNPANSLNAESVAHQLGVNYRVLMHWVEDDPKRRFPAELLAKFCKAVGNFDALDYLEYEAGRLAFDIPATEPAPDDEIKHANRILKEVTEAIGSLMKAYEDGFIEEREARAVIAELDDVVRQCMRVRYWLEQQTKHRLPGR